MRKKQVNSNEPLILDMDNQKLNFPRPKNFPYSEVFYSDGKIALMLGVYKNSRTKSLGLRWMTGESKLGYPSNYGKEMWMVVPDKLSMFLLNGIYSNIVSERKHIANFEEFLDAYVYIKDLTNKYHLKDNEIENICPIFQNFKHGQQDILQLITLPGDRNKGIKELSQFTKDTKKLMIIDPYFFSGSKGTATAIANDFKKSARIGSKSLKSIHIIYDDKNCTKKIANSISDLVKDSNVKLTTATTNTIHDRIWISDRNNALIVGTSLNGIGNKAAFLIPLPHKDLTDLLNFLDDKNLSRAI